METGETGPPPPSASAATSVPIGTKETQVPIAAATYATAAIQKTKQTPEQQTQQQHRAKALTQMFEVMGAVPGNHTDRWLQATFATDEYPASPADKADLLGCVTRLVSPQSPLCFDAKVTLPEHLAAFAPQIRGIYEMITTTVRRSRESNRSDLFQRTYEMITTTVRRSRESNRSDEKEAKKWKGGPRWDMPRRGRNRWSAEAVARG
ncbi:BZ3500_MvSof-1268-A1-R1_C035g00002 [Microbotryum saponariae]|uniref:BZ3500_MvSof-1268-A1-R1_C035g00002 protein n=1 Tax=Microbotryum saponariae TaxID=289078 RepID=A0A2X0L9E9_9BASI|nr:BZ3500_MvSof-1268-A1-R1_C035g00002 [Microbotryum saponariae]